MSPPEDLDKDTWHIEQNSKKKEEESNDGLEQTVTVWLLTVDCSTQLKSQLSKSAGNMATASNNPPYLELSPSPSKLVDKTGSRGKIWNCFFLIELRKTNTPWTEENF